MIKKLQAGLFVLSFAAIGSAHAAPMISIFGLGNYNLYSEEALGVEIKGTIGFGGGLSFETMISNGIGLDVGAAYQRQGAKATALGQSETRYVDSIHVPVGLRFGIGSSASALIGGYFDYSLEEDDAGETEHDYGAVAGFRVRTGPVFFEPRFKYGFNDDYLDGNMEAQLLIGYTFGAKK